LPNSIYYIALVGISLVLIMISAWKVRDHRLYLFYFFMAGIITPFEYLVIILGDGYRYIPNIHHDPMYDSIIGAYISDYLMLPSVAQAIAAYRLRLRWILLIILVLTGIEELFIYLDVYHHNWYKTIYTGAGLFLYFSIGKYVWGKIFSRDVARWQQALLILVCYYTVHGAITYLFVVPFNVFKFHLGFMKDSSREHFILSFPAKFVISLLAMVFIVFTANRILRFILIIAIVLFDWFLVHTGIIHFHHGWTMYHLLLVHFVVLAFLFYLNKKICEK
jgi:hypothetical protein